MDRRPRLSLLGLLLVAGCATTTTEAPKHLPPPPRAATGVDRVMGHDARTLVALFGPPMLDLREGPARKLQFRGPACVLDAYLYPPGGGGELKVTWIDARTPAGAEFDRASCIAALVRR
ncbi:hypothetical protein [Sphingomonas bacterium]|uniref:hypothetical protein n=1 Tax=Sphingomonas bacterium TaxID=1895847 RepID=UPI001575B2B3|nr:hypothetical protein [Sphingomonas bacterium]